MAYIRAIQMEREFSLTERKLNEMDAMMNLLRI
jgi:hypothetical protein